jgi:hypothetical protein
VVNNPLNEGKVGGNFTRHGFGLWAKFLPHFIGQVAFKQRLLAPFDTHALFKA